MGLETEGIIFMAIAFAFIFGVASYCYFKIFTTEKK